MKFKWLLFMLCLILLVGCGTTTVQGDNKNQDDRKNDRKSNVLTAVKKLADQGKVVGSDRFGVGSIRAEIEQAWGKSQPGHENAEDYPKQLISIYYVSDKVDQIITRSPKVTNIYYDEVIRTLGEPAGRKSDEGITHLFYHAGSGNKYDLTITLTGENPKVSQITVGNKPIPDPDQVTN